MSDLSAKDFTLRVMHLLSYGLLVMLAACAGFYTILSALGYVPWLTMPLMFGDIAVENGGVWVQSAVTAILVSFMFFAPSTNRMLALEKSHRNFRISMEDVTKAYQISHAADRAGLFTTSSEFDAVRERMQFLRDHPDLGTLEQDLLTVASQMGEKSRELADIYSDDKIARAKRFLAERQAEAERQQEQIIEALHICREVRAWADQVETEESVVANQLEQLDRQLQSVLPQLGYGFEDAEDIVEDNVVAMPPKSAAE